MSDICTIRKSTLDGIAEAIQSKTGESGGMLPSEMREKVLSIPSGAVQGDWLKIHSEEITVGQNSISGSKDMVDYLKAAAAEFNEGQLIQFSVIGDPKVNRMYYYSDPNASKFGSGWRYQGGRLLQTTCNNNSYDGFLPAGTRVVLYIAEEVAY